MKRVTIGAAATFAMLALSGCGRGEETPGQPSADERQKLDNIATKLDDAGTFDTSADSLVPANEAASQGNGVVAAPANTAAPAANGAAPR